MTSCYRQRLQRLVGRLLIVKTPRLSNGDSFSVALKSRKNFQPIPDSKPGLLTVWPVTTPQRLIPLKDPINTKNRLKRLVQCQMSSMNNVKVHRKPFITYLLLFILATVVSPCRHYCFTTSSIATYDGFTSRITCLVQDLCMTNTCMCAWTNILYRLEFKFTTE